MPVNLSRIKAVGPWIAEGKYLWLVFAPFLLALLAILLLGPTERVFRITGLVLQLFGISTIIRGISETRKLFGHSLLASKIKAWFQRFPLRRRDIVLAGAGIQLAAATGKGRASVTHNAGPNATLDARVEALEKNMASIRNEIAAVEAELDEGFQKVKDEIRSEVQGREADDKKLGDKIEATATGGIYISAIGASWLFVGVILSTAAPELAALLKWWA